ncbi:peptidylprolyl isomerase [Pasteurellaceae bacterium 22721_9_1]
MFMEKMHHASNSGIAKAVLALIGVSFVITGMYGYLGRSADTFAVKINGEEVSQAEFQQQYNNEYQRSSQLLGAKFAEVANTPEFTKGIRASVLNRMIEQKLLTQYITDLKLGVSDERIKQEIVRTPMFQMDGKFSNEAYQQVLRNNNMTADMYAAYVREALRFEQLQSGLNNSVFLLPTSQEEFAKLFFQQRKVRFAQLPLADEIAKQQVSEQEIKAYYDANSNAFIVPELVKVQYLDLNKEIVNKSITVDDTKIQQYYQDNKSQFMSKGQQNIAHIQFANETDALDAYQALQNGADFAELAKTKSTDKLSGDKGGELGWFSNGDLPKDFEDAAILVEVGKFSTPVKIDGSYHIILVKDRKGATVLPFEQVKTQIAQQVRQDLTHTQFYTIEKKAAEKAFEDQSSLKAAADAAGVEVKETGYFSRDDIPVELNFPNVVHAMFDGDVSQGNMNSEPMNVEEQHSIVVRVLEHKPQAKKTLDEAKAEIETLLKRQKAEVAVLAKANELAKSLASNKEAKVDGVNFGKQETWVYAQNKDPVLNNVIFAMKPEQDHHVYQVAQTNSGDVVIIALDGIENVAVEQAAKEQFAAKIMQGKAFDLQANLLKSLRAKAKIEVNDEFMNQSAE